MPIRVNPHLAPKPVKPRGRPKNRTTALVPAARTAVHRPDALTPAESNLNGDAINVFIKAVGGRAALTDVLSIAGDAPEVEKVTNYLLDPRFSDPHRWGIRKICQLSGLTVADLFAAYRKALIAKAHIEAAHIIAGKLPPIVADVMDRATPSPTVCAHCEGKPAAPGERACLFCHGSGTMMSEPELDRQKLALELGQLTAQKGGGLFIQQNQGVLAGAAAVLTSQGTGSLEQLQQAVGDLLFSPNRRRAAAPRVVDAVMDPPSEPSTSPRHDPSREMDVPLPFGDPDADDPSDDEDEDDPDDDAALR